MRVKTERLVGSNYIQGIGIICGLPTVRSKKGFINDLISNTKKSILSKVKEMPGDWDGIELRQFIADYFEANTVIKRLLYGQRKANYNNTIRVRNLL